MTRPLNAPDGTPIVLLPPDHPLRCLHNDGAYEDYEDWCTEMFGRGAGDPDGYDPPYTAESAAKQDADRAEAAKHWKPPANVDTDGPGEIPDLPF
jgi:hypothetical protein